MKSFKLLISLNKKNFAFNTKAKFFLSMLHVHVIFFHTS